MHVRRDILVCITVLANLHKKTIVLDGLVEKDDGVWLRRIR